MINLNKYLILAIVILILFLGFGIKQYFDMKADRNRIADNFSQVTKDNQVLNLTLGEYKDLNTRASAKLDSLIKVNSIKPKSVKQATIINTVYRDTGSIKTIYLPAEKQPDLSYKIPISVKKESWSMKGVILSTDQNSKLNITELQYSNSAQLLIVRKRFLGFLWYGKKTEYKAYSDYGEINFTQINFLK